jgi:hypothetical protein
MSVTRALPALLVVFLGVRADAATPMPRVICRDDGRCTVLALPAVLRDAEVLDYLRSGLTTTLAVSLSARGERGQKLAAAGRIDVRFEPWEESFDVEVRVPGSVARAQRVASERELHAWWRDLTLSFVLPVVARGSAQVHVELVPFSEEEQADARHWYAETLRAAPTGGTGSSAVGGVLDALTLTSIKRRGVLRFSWTAPVEPLR